MNPSKIRLRASAFTLVEVLVAVGIIAVLAGIAISVFGRMQRSGLTSKSTSNLRQISAMVMAYTGDHNGQLPRAVHAAGEDPNGINDGLPHYWRRVVWESQQGPLGSTYSEQVANLTSGAYSKTMWCPVQVAKHKRTKTGFLEGHGSYSMNKFFFLWKEFIAEGAGDRRPSQEGLVGKQEPFIAAGTSNGDLGTYAYFESSNPPSNGVYDKPPWHNMAYDYGSSGDRALALFLDGRIELIDPDKGRAISSLVSDHRDFQ